jgi:tripartite-type tricarboxylate transporter receptor subunit TctC
MDWRRRARDQGFKRSARLCNPILVLEIKKCADEGRDIAPVAALTRDANVMLVNPSFPAKTVPEFIAYAKANPGKINMVVAAGGASTPFLAGELFKEKSARDLPVS